MGIDNNQGDRNNITLLHGGKALIAATAAACSNTIVITHTVGSVTVEDWVDNPGVTAVLHAGVPGQETGNAVVDVLFSDSPQATDPCCGHLPYKIAKAREDSPADVLYTSIDGTPQRHVQGGAGD
ncbi:glycoside hydrolase family 3 C-terminal domain-containing protein [Mycena albidolilacea]|uniref:beta-glucosidase n=1 Tax=Mycena albidolilacea TaxID=1033008 RepID=A0AAD6ZK19_9AGAR|nr:glycoside hydrolase family 3 C-terminal domain-containing protein [Mycena albidolilacea]